MSAAVSRCCASAVGSRFGRLAAFAVAYFVGAELGHLLTFRGPYGDFASYWPPSGLYVAAMLAATRFSTRAQLVAAACLANVTSDVWLHELPLPVSLGFCLANMVEALAGAWAVRRLKILQDGLLCVRDVAGMAIVAAACSGPAAAIVGSTVLWLEFGGSWIDPFREWWVSVIVGEIVFVPLFWKLFRTPRQRRPPVSWTRVFERAAALVSLAFAAYLIFHVGERPIAYLSVPFSLWLALRAGTGGVVLGNVVLSVIAVWYTARGQGPIGHIEPHTFRALFIQVFNVTAAMCGLMLSAVVNERQRSLDERVESDERFRDLFDNVSDLVAVADNEGSILFANQAWSELIGVSVNADDLSLVDLLHPDARGMFLHVLEVLPEAGVLTGIELQIVTRAGAVLDVEGSFSCRSPTGATNRIRMIFRDVTSRKVTAQKLERAHQQLEAANMQLRLLATTDGLTALANRRAFYDRLDQECHSASRHDRPLSLILLDVDHFKSFNDTFGHPAGDDALRTVGWLLKESLRDFDVAGRVGGEEFAVVLPETDETEALLVAERLRKAIGEFRWPLRRISASLGVATFYGSDAEQELIVEAADQALYQAKRGGRDQTVRASCRRLSSLLEKR